MSIEDPNTTGFETPLNKEPNYYEIVCGKCGSKEISVTITNCQVWANPSGILIDGKDFDFTDINQNNGSK